MKKAFVMFCLCVFSVFGLYSSSRVSFWENAGPQFFQISVCLFLAFVFLLSVFIVIWQYKLIKKKNRYLAQMIVRLNELSFAENSWNRQKYSYLQSAVNNDKDSVEIDNLKMDYDDDELFHRFNDQVLKEKLYLNYNYGRDDYSRIMGVDKNRFAAIIKEYGGGNISTYLNNLRLEYSVQLLISNQEMSVKDVAARSAFPNSATYYRLFKEKYGISPNTYRNNRQSDKY